MKYRLLAFALLVFSFTSPSHALYFGGELTETDLLGEDIGWGNFYYDMYYLRVKAPMEIYIFMNPSDPFIPYLAYWDGDFSATPDFDTPPPEIFVPPNGVGERVDFHFTALPDIDYQIMAATWEYNPTNLGSYHFFVLNSAGADGGFEALDTPFLTPQQSVPAPASWLVLGLGLVILGMVNRFVPVTTSVLTARV